MPDTALASIIDRIQQARSARAPVRLLGGGTKDFYGEALQGDVLDMRELAGISSYEPSELVVTARAGTALNELEATLAEKGQCLAFEPPRFADGGTVGGMVAAGLSGPSRASVGSVRDFVLGATMINGRGEVLSFGGQVMKNVAGYDVSRLLAGSLGVLGAIAEVSLKVLPVAPATVTIRFERDQTQALEMLHGWAGQPLPLNASAWLPRFVTVTVFGLSVLVAPIRVLAKLSAALETFTFSTRLLDQSTAKIFPLPSAVTPYMIVPIV